MKKLFHGTTFENFENILKNGFNTDKQNWFCSEDNYVYFFDLEKNTDGCSLEEAKNDCIRMAFENAQICASVQDYNKNGLVVLEFDIDEKYCEDDDSCEDMKYTCTCVDSNNLNINLASKVYYSECYNKSFRLFYVSNLYNNKFLNFENFSNAEKSAIRLLNKRDVFIEELFEIEWCEL